MERRRLTYTKIMLVNNDAWTKVAASWLPRASGIWISRIRARSDAYARSEESNSSRA